MTLFARYYDENSKLIEVSMKDMDVLIQDQNKDKISDFIYHRLYVRFLKPFYYDCNVTKEYVTNVGILRKNVYETEFKSGFLMMASSCLLIETLAAYFRGNDHSIGSGNDNYNYIFKKCEQYSNPLKIFQNEDIYKNIRCGILHQGETYDQFIIRRTGELYDQKEKSINAFLFVKYLHIFLESYITELKETSWADNLWINCLSKIKSIIAKTK